MPSSTSPSTAKWVSLAAIDVGSNAIRMIVGQAHGHQIHILHRLRSPVRLGKDVFHTGLIGPETMSAAVDTFVKFAKIMRESAVRRYRAVATSATREAKNGATFIEVLRQKSGIQVEIIDGLEEAKLIHTAIRHEVRLDNAFVAGIDVGGGSIEVTFSENGKITATRSFPLGTVRLLEILEKRKMSEKDLGVILGEHIGTLTNFIEQETHGLPVDFAVGTGGNLDCMMKLKGQLLGREGMSYITLQELGTISDMLAKLSVRERQQKLKLKPDRADVIYPATLLVKTFLGLVCSEKLIIPRVGVREGILWSLF
ncbi:MAG: hypothetical protein N2578_07045 [Bdellovibrionaceae bacterium]|nr:hypothetical protein [Pseudobdellovibrionaceae bacterium]